MKNIEQNQKDYLLNLGNKISSIVGYLSTLGRDNELNGPINDLTIIAFTIFAKIEELDELEEMYVVKNDSVSLTDTELNTFLEGEN